MEFSYKNTMIPIKRITSEESLQAFLAKPKNKRTPSVSLPGFTTLPFELQILILRLVLINDPSDYLTHLGDGDAERLPLDSKREQLKRVRLISRAFCAAVDPAVFASIHISTSRLSLQRAQNIANSNLAGHVKEIVYHEGSFDDRNPDLKLFLSTLASHRRRQDYPASLKKIQGKELHQNYLSEIEEAQRCEALNGPTMADILEKLPNLETYVHLPYHNEWHDPETSAYTIRRVGLSYLPMKYEPCTDQTMNFIKAMNKAKITKLNLARFPTFTQEKIICPGFGASSINKDTKGESELDDSGSLVQNLRRLKIGGDFSPKYGQPSSGVDAWTAKVDTFLSKCKSLTHLELTFGFANDARAIPPLQLVPPGSLPRLQFLTLSDLSPTTKALKQCLVSLGPSLRHLRFKIVRLQSDGSTERKPRYEDSIVELLFDVTPSMNLETCTGVNTVRCCKTEKTALMVVSGHKPGKAVMVKKVEEAVCKKRKWPKSILDGGSSNSAFPNSMKRVAFFQSQWEEMVDLFEETPYDWHTFVSY